LPVQKNNARRLVLEDHELTLAPSASVLAALERQADRRPAEKLLAITADAVFSRSDGRVALGSRSHGLAWRFDRLPATAEEARRLGSVAAAYAPLVQSGFDAQAAWVLSDAARDFRWLHFATHAFFDPRYPEQSGLVLSLVDRVGQPIDGLLTPGKLRRLELEAELVVLSACATALGQQFEGEGVVGLAQAFFTGGASRLVASLWEVPDNELTVSLMEDFYRRLLAGETPPAALRAAQLKQHREGVSPRQWAAFVFIGPWSPLAPLPAGR
ncbi:MAG: CHAT domain-containing protein, partial [Acidobacteriota bacterium]